MTNYTLDRVWAGTHIEYSRLLLMSTLPTNMVKNKGRNHLLKRPEWKFYIIRFEFWRFEFVELRSLYKFVCLTVCLFVCLFVCLCLYVCLLNDGPNTHYYKTQLRTEEEEEEEKRHDVLSLSLSPLSPLLSPLSSQCSEVRATIMVSSINKSSKQKI